jgi:glycine/D-amino acid oxidase-like deaminating enzyme
LQRRVLPIGSFIIATEVLDPELAHSISPRNRMLVDSKNLLFYWRLTPDGRLAFGGRKSLRTTTVTDAADFLYDSMIRVHPQLSGTAIDFAWGGEVALTVDRLPHVGSFGRVAYATGCNGSGVALMPWLGMRMADAMVGEGPPPPFIELRHRPVPLTRWRRLWTPIVGSWFRMQDRRR